MAPEFNRDNKQKPAPRGQEEFYNYHGQEVPDTYRFLEKDTEERQSWIDSEQERLREFLGKKTESIESKEKLSKEYFETRYDTTPKRYGDKYFSSYRDGSAQPVHRVRDSMMGEPKTLIDAREFDPNGNVSIRSTHPSPDGMRIAYLLSSAGSDETTMHIRDVGTGKDFDDMIEGCSMTAVMWDKNSSDSFLYSYPSNEGDGKRRKLLKHHTIGTNVKEDPIIYDNPDIEMNTVFPFRISDEKGGQGKYEYMRENVGSVPNYTTYRRDSSNPEKGFELFFKDDQSTTLPIAEIEGKVFAITNQGAEKNRLVAIDPENTNPENWKTIIPEHDEDMLKDVLVHGGQVYASYKRDKSARIAIHELDGTYRKDIPIPENSNVRITDNEDQLYFDISSYRSPMENYRYKKQDNSLELSRKSEFQINMLDEDKYIVERLKATSKDGTQVPMTVVRRSDTELDGSAAVQMDSYGGFNGSFEPRFLVDIYDWVDKGGIYVETNLRGGGDFGKEWSQSGKIQKKQNTIDDLAACATKLIDDKYTSPERLAITGGSHGGMVVLAAALQNPDLFGAVIASVPVTDMLGFERHKYGAAWKSEFGDPKNNQEDFEAVMGYSPLHNIEKEKKYPPILVSTGDKDTRVDPSDTYKFIATFHEKAHPDSLAIMRIEKDAGHGEGTALHKKIAESIDKFAFLEKTLGPINQNDYKIEQLKSNSAIVAKPQAETQKPPISGSKRDFTKMSDQDKRKLSNISQLLKEQGTTTNSDDNNTNFSSKVATLTGQQRHDNDPQSGRNR